MLQILGHKFKNQALAKQYVRSLILKYPHGSPITDPEDKAFVTFLISLHSEKETKIGLGVKDFISIRDFNKNPALLIERIDGSKVDVSWVHCITGQKKKEIVVAMRQAIKEQILDFKHSSVLVCEICSSTDKIHVDHQEPTFKELVKEFLEANPNQPKDFNECPNTNMAIFKLEDKEFSMAWQKFHAINAKLRILCSKCNLAQNTNI